MSDVRQGRRRGPGLVSGPIAICVYCASARSISVTLDLAAEVVAIARAVTPDPGGGNVSMMGLWPGRCGRRRSHRRYYPHRADGAREVADTGADELIVTDTMRQRKQQMDDRADAFITLPGGIGTLEELFETWMAAIWDARQTGDPSSIPRVLRAAAGMAGRPHRRRVRLAACDGQAAGDRFRGCCVGPGYRPVR